MGHIEGAMGTKQEREGTVAYVCGPQRMTDEVVVISKSVEGVKEKNVMCEKWW